MALGHLSQWEIKWAYLYQLQQLMTKWSVRHRVDKTHGFQPYLITRKSQEIKSGDAQNYQKNVWVCSGNWAVTDNLLTVYAPKAKKL